MAILCDDSLIKDPSFLFFDLSISRPPNSALMEKYDARPCKRKVIDDIIGYFLLHFMHQSNPSCISSVFSKIS